MSLEGTRWAKIQELVEKHTIDYEKALEGNKAAGTRARIALMSIKKLAHDERKNLTELKKKV